MFFFFTLLVMVVLSRFTKIPRSILIIVWGNFTGLCFMNKYSIEEKCKTVSELNDKDRKQIAEEIIKHNKIVNLLFFGLARVDTNKYSDLFPDTEITSNEAECEVLGKGKRSILPYFFDLSCVLSLILFGGIIFGGIIMEGEPL